MDGKTIVAVLIAGIGATLIDNLAAQRRHDAGHEPSG